MPSDGADAVEVEASSAQPPIRNSNSRGTPKRGWMEKPLAGADRWLPPLPHLSDNPTAASLHSRVRVALAQQQSRVERRVEAADLTATDGPRRIHGGGDDGVAALAPSPRLAAPPPPSPGPPPLLPLLISSTPDGIL